MFDFDTGKLLIIGLVALVVIGPKDLPRVLRQIGQAVGKLRRMAGEFQGQFMDAMKEADLQDLKTEIAKLKDSATLDVDFDPARDVKHHLTEALSDSSPAGGAVGSLSAGPTETQRVELPPPSEVAPDATLASAGIGPVADAGLAEPSGPHVAPGAAEPLYAVADSRPAPESVVLPPEIVPRESEPSTARRKIVVTRRRRLSRLDGPTLRAAALTGRSRNIFPARRDTKDR